jgi:hypothetical protein
MTYKTLASSLRAKKNLPLPPSRVVVDVNDDNVITIRTTGNTSYEVAAYMVSLFMEEAAEGEIFLRLEDMVVGYLLINGILRTGVAPIEGMIEDYLFGHAISAKDNMIFEKIGSADECNVGGFEIFTGINHEGKDVIWAKTEGPTRNSYIMAWGNTAWEAIENAMIMEL